MRCNGQLDCKCGQRRTRRNWVFQARLLRARAGVPLVAVFAAASAATATFFTAAHGVSASAACANGFAARRVMYKSAICGWQHALCAARFEKPLPAISDASTFQFLTKRLWIIILLFLQWLQNSFAKSCTRFLVQWQILTRTLFT